MFKRLTSTALVFGMAALAPPAATAQTCGPRDQLITQLTERYQEVSRGVGLSSATQVVEFWASNKTGTFSVLLTYPNGLTCILATGSNWTEAPHLASNSDPKA
ncbi:hypothetical protein OAC63_00190 [Amylibacter sp.]|nr:hypothetical protein [Amylibacter sp.]